MLKIVKDKQPLPPVPPPFPLGGSVFIRHETATAQYRSVELSYQNHAVVLIKQTLRNRVDGKPRLTEITWAVTKHNSLDWVEALGWALLESSKIAHEWDAEVKGRP